MDNPRDKLTPMGIQSKETMDLAAARARDALDTAGATTDRAIDKAADKLDDAKQSARKVVDKAAGVTRFVADKGADDLVSARNPVRDRLTAYSDQLADYTAAEPVKAMLIAAATGAVLMALLSMMTSSRDWK